MLAPLSQYLQLLSEIWDAHWLTNGGDKSLALEAALREYLGVPNLSVFTNGTLALMIALRALDITGEVITTPFTFPATPHSLLWSQLTPVFADIEESTLTLDPEKVEALITPRTSAILGVHVYGMPCQVNELALLAKRYGLRLIYDGAHAFGTNLSGTPIGLFGDATMFSFHATKLFHTAEGGGLAVRDPQLQQRINLMRNFGIESEDMVDSVGINAKMTELQAAVGLVNLRLVDAERERRASIRARYRLRIEAIPGLTLFEIPATVHNSEQFLIVRVAPRGSQSRRDKVQADLREFNIITRRYFYPLCSTFPCYSSLPSSDPKALPIAHLVSEEVLALPLYGALADDDVEHIADVLEYVASAV
jgi:dTDP-4-amino-4,6-dideoxygalactose transaminase